jgi:hypothetical protein
MQRRRRGDCIQHDSTVIVATEFDVPDSMLCDLIVCGRSFSQSDLVVICDLITSRPAACRRDIAKWTCQRLRWLTPGGKLKEMSCRVALLRLEAQGLIRLPAPRRRNGNRKPFEPDHTIAVPEGNVVCAAGSLSGLRLEKVETTDDSRLWNEAIGRFHYLGYKRLPGAQIRYLLQSTLGLLGVLGFGASAWKAAPRDRWIGWSDAQRKERLHLVVNNARFLLLPWVRSRNLASWALSQCARRLPLDWQVRYGYHPVLLETFVERGRFRGTCYKASNWSYVGDTQGRGKLDRYRTAELPIKQIFLYPLIERFREVLCA